jgi:hypothetical protein
MPKVLFYAGTAFCLFLALTSAAEAARQIQSTTFAFAAVGAGGALSTRAGWAIAVSLVAGLASAAIFLRMAALLAARNLFGAFMAIFAVSGAVITLAALLFVQSRMVIAADPALLAALGEIHLAASMILGFFVGLGLLSMRPYFRVQASRFLSISVAIPLPLFGLIVVQEMFVKASVPPLPAASPASIVFFATVAVLFFAIGVHCIRHRHLFLEMTNLRELLDGRVDPGARPTGRPIRLGGAAFDS